MTDQFAGLFLEVTAVGLVHEGERAVGLKAADELGLILNHGAIASLTLP